MVTIPLLGGDQKRRSRDDGTNFTAYRWDIGFNVMHEEDDQGALERTYVHGGAAGFSPTTGSLDTFVPIVMGPVRPILADLAGATPASGTIRHYAHDHLGSTRGIYDANKNLAGIWEPTPYGEAHTDTLAGTITHRYTGHALDPTTGNYHTAYRTYAPTMARWMQRDPLGMVDGPNVYGYVTNAPTSLFDPLGLITPECKAAKRYALAACGVCLLAMLASAILLMGVAIACAAICIGTLGTACLLCLLPYIAGELAALAGTYVISEICADSLEAVKEACE